MAVVSVTVNGRLYEVACDDSQVDKVRHLAGILDERAQILLGQLGVQPEARILVMIGLMLADELAEAKAELQEARARLGSVTHKDSGLADGLVAFARRIEAIAERLEHA